MNFSICNAIEKNLAAALPTTVFYEDKIEIKYDTLQEAIQNRDKYPEEIFQQKGSGFVANHQQYLNYLDNPERFLWELKNAFRL